MSHDGLKVAVLVAAGRHPVSGRARQSQADAAALEMALNLVSNMAPGAAITVLSAGPHADHALDAYLGLGAGTIEWLAVADEAEVASALQARLAGFDLVLCGARAEGGHASGLLPYRLAAGLDLPVVPDALTLTVTLDRHTAMVVQWMPKGLRRRLEVDLPAVIAVHPRAPQSSQTGRKYAFARAQAGRIVKVAAPANASPHESPGEPPWRFEPITRRPRALKAQLQQSGHARMLGAIGGQDGKTAGQVVKTGDAVEKAQVVLEYLREHRLVDF